MVVNKNIVGSISSNNITDGNGPKICGTVQAEQFPLYDAHGNMVNTLSRASGGSFALGNSSFRYYDAWGSLDSGLGTGNEPRQRYCANLGHLQDDESGLIYMRARYYEPGTGRFVSEDPAMDGVNWLVYCSNDPTNQVDFSGRHGLAEGQGLILEVLHLLGVIKTFIQATIWGIHHPNQYNPLLAGLGLSLIFFSGALLSTAALVLADVAVSLVGTGPWGVTAAVILGVHAMLLLWFIGKIDESIDEHMIKQEGPE